MAQPRYIEIYGGDTWKSVSVLFKNWLTENGLTEDFGWSEGDILEINDDLAFYCFNIPDHHGKKINLFEDWAKKTGRLYGIETDRKVVFPKDTSLNVILPPHPTVELPPWLK